MDRLTVSRKKCIAEIKAKLGKAKERKPFPSCWYGIECRRLFCKFSHKHVFNKVNASYKKPTNQAENLSNHSDGFLCDHCGKLFQTQKAHIKHIPTCLEENPQIGLESVKCGECVSQKLAIHFSW